MDAIDVARFWSKVDVKAGNRACWLWRGARDSEGYGATKIAGRMLATHRVALGIVIGQQAIEGRVVRHSCDTPACCNPFHLSAGSHGDNVRDRVVRDRSAHGTSNGRHKLTPEQVTAIRASGASHSELGRAYGVHWSTIKAARTGRTWQRLECDPAATQASGPPCGGTGEP